jgi:hypothetical protein
MSTTSWRRSARRPTVNAGEKSKRQQPSETGLEPDARDRRQGGEDRREPKQQQVELVDRLALVSVGEFALAERAAKEAEKRDTADPRHLLLGHKAAADAVGNQRPENREIQHVEEVAGRDQCQQAPMERAHPRLVHRLADEGLDGLRRQRYRRLSPLAASAFPSRGRPLFRRRLMPNIPRNPELGTRIARLRVFGNGKSRLRDCVESSEWWCWQVA